MQRIEIAGLNGKDLPVERLGLVQLSALMMRDRAPQQIGDVQFRSLEIGHWLAPVATGNVTHNATNTNHSKTIRSRLMTSKPPDNAIRLRLTASG